MKANICIPFNFAIKIVIFFKDLANTLLKEFPHFPTECAPSGDPIP